MLLNSDITAASAGKKIMNKKLLLKLVKNAIYEIEPSAEIILYGSRARNDETPESDWDLLILLDGDVDDARADKIRHRLYEIEWEHDAVLCSVICSRQKWDSPRYQTMPFHKNVKREGIVL
jgi:predicted nucleotidyltransferase